jgi:predicted enzyme related to lactoylglutathione lyase
MNSPYYFEIQADDLQRAIQFYRSVFGWSIEEQPGTEVEYYRIETQGIAGGLLPRPAPVGQGGGTNAAVLSMQVENFDAIAQTIAGAGGQEALPKFAVPGKCWQGYFIDTEGNTFGIFQADETAA